MLAIKLQRIGKKHQPSYRFVVAPKKSKMAAPPVEDLGAYNPSTKAASVNKERALHWMKMGAQPTTTVHNLFIGQGIITGKALPIKMKKAVVAVPAAEAPAPVAEAAPAKEAKAEAEAPVTPETPAA